MENAQINAVIEANNSAVGAGDMDAIIATFEENGVLVGQPGMTAQGNPAFARSICRLHGDQNLNHCSQP